MIKGIRLRIAGFVAAIGMVVAGAAGAATLTGMPVDASGHAFDSTNELNYTLMVPGRIGQDAPYVLFDSNTSTSVTLEFFNPGPGLAFFEYQIDGVLVGATPHPVVAGSVIHPGQAVSSGAPSVLRTFAANNYVDIRLALGGERDWDFGWTRFETEAAAVIPLPASFPLILVGLGGLGLLARRKKTA